MGFMEEVKSEASKIQNGNRLIEIEKVLGKKEYAEFVAAVKDHSIACSAINRVLKSRGVKVSENTIRKYRSENVFG